MSDDEELLDEFVRRMKAEWQKLSPEQRELIASWRRTEREICASIYRRPTQEVP